MKNMFGKSEATVCLLLCSILALCAVADKVGDAIDTREKMAVEAATSVTQAYDKIRQDGITHGHMQRCHCLHFP